MIFTSNKMNRIKTIDLGILGEISEKGSNLMKSFVNDDMAKTQRLIIIALITKNCTKTFDFGPLGKYCVNGRNLLDIFTNKKYLTDKDKLVIRAIIIEFWRPNDPVEYRFSKIAAKRYAKAATRTTKYKWSAVKSSDKSGEWHIAKAPYTETFQVPDHEQQAYKYALDKSASGFAWYALKWTNDDHNIDRWIVSGPGNAIMWVPNHIQLPESAMY